MKKNATIILILLSFAFLTTQSAYSQAMSCTTLKAGYFNPKESKGGFIFGLNYSWIIDESVDIGFAADFFRKNYTKETTVASQEITNIGITETTIQKEAEFTTNVLPIYGVLNVKFPAGTYLDYFITGGLGYEMLFSKEKTYGEDANDKSRFYAGFKWLLGGGIMYRVGSRSSFLAEIFYDGTKVSRDKKNETGLPTRAEVDLSGIGLRIGIRMGMH